MNALAILDVLSYHVETAMLLEGKVQQIIGCKKVTVIMEGQEFTIAM